jgi:hypothetical protein
MQLVWERLTLKFNPFTKITHNFVSGLRILFHVLHVLSGFIPALILFLCHVHLVWWQLAILGVVISTWLKFTWIDTTHRRFHPWIVPPTIELWDAISDTGLTLLGMVWMAPWISIPIYYLLSIFNGQ